VVVNYGGNPVIVNATAVPAGREHALKPGDRLYIAGYEIAILAPGDPYADDLADFFGQATVRQLASEPPPRWDVEVADTLPAFFAASPQSGLRSDPAVARTARREVADAGSVPAGAVFSWDNPPREGRVVTLPGVPRTGSKPTLAWQRAEPAQRPSEELLLAALLEGLGAPALDLKALTPELMLTLGQLLRETVAGLQEMLAVRSALQRDVRADLTLLSAGDNNPLKLAEGVEAALAHLLGPRLAGVMAPPQAVRAGFDDVRAHQAGWVAGMGALLDRALQRFDPRQLETMLSRRSSISTLIPAARKAQLWDLYQDLFLQLQNEVRDDFDSSLGRAFASAYEERVESLRREAHFR
jgi:type VI secretion system FHA domain protein